LEINWLDSILAYLGSANLSGAGMGDKASETRKFENGIVTDDPAMGALCDKCKRRAFCPDIIDKI